MPILEAHHDYGHPVEADTAWSESYYFNGYDPAAACGFFTRIGIRPNEGTMDVGLSLWLPDGRLAEYHAVVEQHSMVDTTLVVEGVTYELLEPLTTWRLRALVTAKVRDCVAGSHHTDSVEIDLDLTFSALTPAIGTDGQARVDKASSQSAAAAVSTGKGHFEQSGRWDGYVSLNGEKLTWAHAHGNRDRSWGPRHWGGPSMWRWFSINIGDGLHFGGIRLGTPSGDLHRGWVWNENRATSVAAWNMPTALAEDNYTHRVVHLEVLDKSGRSFQLRGDVLRVADIGRAGGTVINEGLTRWTNLATGEVGHGIAEYLHQLDSDARPVVAVE
ncbi:MAG: hypothetical protein WCG86_07180 [Actinomycetota bacterium]